MTHFLVLSLYLFGWFDQPTQPVPTNSIRLLGICYDVTTAAYLPVVIYAISGTGRSQLGQSDKDGKFNVLLPLSATSISFASPTYRTVTLPVTFVNNPTPMTDFGVGIIMGKQDSAVVKQADRLSVRNDLPNDIDMEYRVEPIGRRVAMTFSAHGNRVMPGMHTSFGKGELMRFMHFEGAKPGPYQAFVSTTDGRVLIDKTFTLTKGLTFLEVRADASDKSAIPSVGRDKLETNTAAPTATVVYFEQSRYELTTATKAALDSVAQLLAKQPRFVARITGYTDNVGERTPNLTLSEYRAKLVTNYLKQKGFSPTKLLIEWKGGSAQILSGDSEKEKAKNRRVVIEVTPD